MAEKYIHAAHSEWIKELGAGRKYSFLNRHNNDIWKYIPEKRLKEIINRLFKTIKAEIKKLASARREIYQSVKKAKKHIVSG